MPDEPIDPEEESTPAETPDSPTPEELERRRAEEEAQHQLAVAGAEETLRSCVGELIATADRFAELWDQAEQDRQALGDVVGREDLASQEARHVFAALARTKRELDRIRANPNWGQRWR